MPRRGGSLISQLNYNLRRNLSRCEIVYHRRITVTSQMLSRLIHCVLFCTLVCGATEIPAGTEIQIRLTAKVASDSSKAKDAVQAVVIAPVMVNGEVGIGAGAKVRGEVVEAKLAQQSGEPATLGLNFTELTGATGNSVVKVKTKLMQVDNARETVDQNGKVAGILTSGTISGRLDQGINKVIQRNSGLGGLLEAAKGAVLRQTNGEIQYAPGTEMTLQVTEPFKWDEKASPPDLLPVADETELYKLVNAQPFQTYAEKPPKPSDMTNLMFIGSPQQLEKVFKDAGWDTAQALDGQSKLETFRAIAELRGYSEAPVSLLTLDGQKPDYVFQKQNNTFAQRHHLRIWRRPGTFGGQPVWVCSATHDTGIAFSEENRTFIHQIDTQIDKERAKVVNDLLFTGGVKSLALVDRAAVPTKSSNATGDALETDARMAVLILK